MRGLDKFSDGGRTIWKYPGIPKQQLARPALTGWPASMAAMKIAQRAILAFGYSAACGLAGGFTVFILLMLFDAPGFMPIQGAYWAIALVTPVAFAFFMFRDTDDPLNPDG